jgi:hypothetical protein
MRSLIILSSVPSETQLQWIKYASYIRITDHIDPHHRSNDILLTDFFINNQEYLLHFFVGECGNSSHNTVFWFVISTGQSIMPKNFFIF